MIPTSKHLITTRLLGPSAFWRTLRFRFAFWVGSLLLLAQLVMGTFVYIQLKDRLFDAVDDTLRLNAVQIRVLVEAQGDTLSTPESSAYTSLSADLQEQQLTARILTPQGEIRQAYGIYRDLPINADVLAAAQNRQERFFTIIDPNETDEKLRVFVTPILQQGQVIGLIETTQALDSVDDMLEQLLILFQFGVPVSVVLAVLGGYGLASRALSRVDRITRMARHLSADDLTLRLDLPATNDEVGRLAQTFDMMLDRLDMAFQRERQFTSDASHELRTPLAAMRTILDMIRSRPRTTVEYEQALDDLAEETTRLQQLVVDLLLLARNEIPAAANHAEIDLSALLTDITDSLRPLAESHGLTLKASITDGLQVVGDRDHLVRLFVNLIDNAIKFTTDGEIVVQADIGLDGRCHITVADTGTGIPAEHLPHIFERFYRADRSRPSTGTGLGLALALSVARAHGGHITVQSVVGQGTTFTVVL